MTQQSTPGPWEWEEHGNGWALYSGRTPTMHGLNILTVDRQGFDSNREANARLIAAAPELLNELRVTVRRLEMCIRHHAAASPEFAQAATEQTWKLIRRIEEGQS